MADDRLRLVPECKVNLAGSPLEIDADAQLAKVLVDLDSDLFGQCQLVFNDPRLELIDGRQFASGSQVQVRLGFLHKLVTVFDGEVTALEPLFRRDQPPALRVVCHEALHRLALSQMTRAFNDVDDKEIATKVAQEHGLTADAPAGSREHHLQSNVSDALLLRRIAAKSGNVLRIEGKKLIIGPPAKGAEVKIEPGSVLTKMKLRISAARQVGEVEVRGWDPKTKKEIVYRAHPEGETGEGAQKYGKSASRAIAGHEPPPRDTATAEAMAKGRLRKIAEGFVVATGEMVGDPRVVPGAVLALEQIGAPLDGSYRVEHAEHFFSRHGYLVKFRAVRVGKPKPPAKALAPPAEKPKTAATDAEQEAAKERAKHGLTNPRWSKPDHEHAESGEMVVDCKNIDGKVVEFVAYHQEPDGNWTEFARKSVIASGTQVKAKIKLLHEDHPDTPAATKGGKRPVPGILSNARWGKTDHAHGEEGEMIVDVRPGHQGETVVFAVERKSADGWEKYGTVEAKVEGGEARGRLSMLHPAASYKSHPESGKAIELRFTAHMQVESGPRAVKFEANIL